MDIIQVIKPKSYNTSLDENDAKNK